MYLLRGHYIQAGIIYQDEGEEPTDIEKGKEKEKQKEVKKNVLCAMNNNRERTTRRLWLVSRFVDHSSRLHALVDCDITLELLCRERIYFIENNDIRKSNAFKI